MVEGTWTIRACDPREAASVASALDLTGTTAGVLVRRGYRDPADAARVPRRRPAGPRPVRARRHAGGVRPDSRGDRGRDEDLRPRRLRRRRDLRDDARGAPAARARRRGRLAPTEPLRGGLRRRRRDARPPGRRGLRARRHGRLRDHGRRGGRRGEGCRARGRRHRPPPARGRAPGLPDRRDATVVVSVPRALRHRRRLQARARRCSGRATNGSSGTSTSSRSRRSPTSSRWSTRTARSRSPGLRRLATHHPARPQGADARGASRCGRRRRGRRRLPARSPDQRRRPPRAADGGARAAPDRRREEAQRIAAELEELNRERQAVEDRILREASAADRRLAGGASQPARLRRRRRGLARGRDRDRRLATRRALPPPGRPDRRDGRTLEGHRPLDFPPSTSTPGSPPAPSTSSASAATAPPRVCRSGPRRSRSSPRRSPPTPTSISPRRTCGR